MRRYIRNQLALWGFLTAAAAIAGASGLAFATVASGPASDTDDSRIAVERYGFCWTRVGAAAQPVCTEITRAAEDFILKCEEFAREQHGYRYGNYKDVDLTRLQARQASVCGTVLPVIKKYECGAEVLCPSATSSSITRKPLEQFVMAKTEAEAVSACLASGGANYVSALKVESLGEGCYLRPVADLK